LPFKSYDRLSKGFNGLAAASFRFSGRNGLTKHQALHPRRQGRHNKKTLLYYTIPKIILPNSQHQYCTNVSELKMPLPTSISNSENPSNSSTSEPGSDTSLRQASSTIANDAGNDAGAQSGSSAAQHTKSEVEKAADKLYEDRIEDEYAKREGGA